VHEVNLDPGESQAWLVPPGDLENLECQEKQEDKAPLELLECLVLRVQMDLEVHLETEDLLETLECLV